MPLLVHGEWALAGCTLLVIPAVLVHTAAISATRRQLGAFWPSPVSGGWFRRNAHVHECCKPQLWRPSQHMPAEVEGLKGKARPRERVGGFHGHLDSEQPICAAIIPNSLQPTAHATALGPWSNHQCHISVLRMQHGAELLGSGGYIGLLGPWPWPLAMDSWGG